LIQRMTADLDQYGRQAMTDLAGRAFKLGWDDARKGNTLRNRREVMQELFEEGSDGRKLHTAKIRQIYGAGFDLSKMHQQIENGEI
jgi:hypothetical protein